MTPREPYPDPDTQPRGPTVADLSRLDNAADEAYDRDRQLRTDYPCRICKGERRLRVEDKTLVCPTCQGRGHE